MHLIVAAIVGALLGLYFYKRKSPLTGTEPLKRELNKNTMF
ncbi:hypothetical protein ACUXQR_002382 [Staphylococcus epidermidis]